MSNVFKRLIQDSYKLRKEYGGLSGIMYGAISSVGFSEVSDIEEYTGACNIDMLYLQNGQTEESISVYEWELENYKIKRSERRIYIKLNGKPEQSIMF